MYKRLMHGLIPVPEGYRRTFRFRDSASDFIITITVTHEGVEIAQEGEAGSRTSSLCLDWIAESIGAVRKELGV